MDDAEVGDFLREFAPRDVQETVGWLTETGFRLDSHQGENTSGAQFVYVAGAKAIITVDRSQWFLDVAPRPGAKAWQYDVLIAAQSGRPYADVFPAAASRGPADPRPEQLP